MKFNKLFHLVFPFIMMAILWIYLAIIWNDLPATIPTHFGINGTPDAFGPKNNILIMPAVFSIVGPGIYFLLINLYRIDPKKKYSATTSGVLSKIAVVMLTLFCAVSLFVLYWTLHGKVEGIAIFLCGISLFFAYMGNLMHSIKPNYFAGFRLPWTLENEENWRKTHQLASRIWFTGGLVLAVASLVLNLKVMIILFISGIVVLTLVPVIYSYKLYKQSSGINNA